jgi:5'/3'-nucleotidase
MLFGAQERLVTPTQVEYHSAARFFKGAMGSDYILITNDDGIEAPGLLALKQALSTLAPVQVIAPDRNWSAAGHTKTMHRPLRIRPRPLRDGSAAYACDGAPSDCVAVALLGFLSEAPVLVVSGINSNANVGSDLTYSGTVTAAMESALSGIPSIAVSLETDEHFQDYAGAAEYARRLAALVLREGLPADTLLNVNAPGLPADQIRGVRITRCGKRIYRDELIERVDPRGHKYYWIGGDKPSGETELEGTDIWALAHGLISITPIHMDMTSHALLERLAPWADELEHSLE